MVPHSSTLAWKIPWMEEPGGLQSMGSLRVRLSKFPLLQSLSYSVFTGKVKVKSLSHVQLLLTPRTAAYQAPPSMGFSRQEYWSGVPLPSLPFAFQSPIMKRTSFFDVSSKRSCRSSLNHLTSPQSLLRRRQWYPTPVLLPGKSHG